MEIEAMARLWGCGVGGGKRINSPGVSLGVVNFFTIFPSIESFQQVLLYSQSY